MFTNLSAQCRLDDDRPNAHSPRLTLPWCQRTNAAMQRGSSLAFLKSDFYNDFWPRGTMWPASEWAILKSRDVGAANPARQLQATMNCW